MNFTFIILFCCIYLLSCSNFTSKEESPIFTQDEKLTSETIYLKSGRTLTFLPESIYRLEGKSIMPSLLEKEFQKYTLSNGLVINILSRHDLPTLNIAVVVDAGKYQFNVNDERLSPLVLKLLTQGTKKYPKTEFGQWVTLLGRPVNYWQTAQYSIISAEILPQDLELALDLISQQLASIEPHDTALRKVIEQQLLENKLTQSSGAYLAKLLFYQNNYPKNHLYYHLQPDSDAIKNVSMDELMNFYQRKYRPERSQIIISGDIDTTLLKQQIDVIFSDWKPFVDRKLSESKPPVFEKTIAKQTIDKQTNSNKQSQFDFIYRKGSQQVDLLFGVITVSRQSSDWPGLKIIAALLGGGPSSRLFADLREKQGLAYYISAHQLAGRYASPFLIQTSVAHDKLINMVNGINNHINYLCHNKVGSVELNQIKQQLGGEIIFKLQTNKQLVNNKIQQLENNLNHNALSELKRKINAVSSEQLLMLTKKYLCGRQQFIAVGDINKLDKNFKNELKDTFYQAHHLPLH